MRRSAIPPENFYGRGRVPELSSVIKIVPCLGGILFIMELLKFFLHFLYKHMLKIFPLKPFDKIVAFA